MAVIRFFKLANDVLHSRYRRRRPIGISVRRKGRTRLHQLHVHAMKLTFCILIAACLIRAAAGQTTTPIPAAVQEKLTALVAKLRNFDYRNITYTPKDYAADVQSLGRAAKAVPGFPEQLKTAPPSAGEQLFIPLAIALDDPAVMKKFEELRAWYGCLEVELPDEYFQKTMAGTFRFPSEPKPSLAEIREEIKKHDRRQHVSRLTATALRAEHTTPDYYAVWYLWLLAPPTKEQRFLRDIVLSAQETMGGEKMFPLLMESFKLATARPSEVQSKKWTAEHYLYLFWRIPGEKALDALLEVNRVALAGNFNGEGRDSVGRQIVRRLASRNPYADQLEDPEMVKMLKQNGKTLERPEDIPLNDDVWKQYKPLVAARLRAQTDATPKADVELLQAAQKVMPKSEP